MIISYRGEILEKVIVWIKERLFLAALVLFGVIYLTCSGNWRVYAEPFVKAGAWLKTQFGSEDVLGEKDIVEEDKEPVKQEPEDVSGSDVSVGDVSKGDVSAGDVSTGDVSVGDADKRTVSGSDADAKSVSGGSVLSEGVSDGDAAKRKKAEAVVSGGDAVNEADIMVLGNASEEPAEGEVVYKTVDEDYFADALFIGDSRTVGMYEYGDLKDVTTFYAATGLTIHKVLDASIVEVEGQKDKLTVEEALQEKQFSKIYFMLGINEMGTGTVDTFMDKYAEVVERIKELQPGATIYLQGIMKVTEERSSKGDYINNEGIEARNVEIAKLADNERVFYLDMNSVVCDENGGLEPTYTGDGVHLKAQYFPLWKEYLMEHAVDTL